MTYLTKCCIYTYLQIDLYKSPYKHTSLPRVDMKTKSDALARLGLTQETSAPPPCTIHHPYTDETDIKPMYFNTLQKHKAVCLVTHSKQ